jgi:hypothetical protein
MYDKWGEEILERATGIGGGKKRGKKKAHMGCLMDEEMAEPHHSGDKAAFMEEEMMEPEHRGSRKLFMQEERAEPHHNRGRGRMRDKMMF